MCTMLRAAVTITILLGAAGPSFAQTLPNLHAAEYGRWEAPAGQSLSPDGRWLAVNVRRTDEVEELRLHRTDRSDVHAVPWGWSAQFSADSRYAAWSSTLPIEERRRLERERKPVRTGAVLRELATGREHAFAEVQSLRFDASGRYLALHGYAPEEPRGKGADLRLVDVRTGGVTTFGNVSEFAWSERGALLAMTVATGADGGNGVHVFDAATGRLRALDASGSTYRMLVWRDSATDLAVLRTAGPASRTGTAHAVLAWRRLDAPTPTAFSLDTLAARAAGVADTLEVVQHARPRWSDDGRRIALGLRPVARRDSARAGGGPGERPDSAARQGASAPPEELPTVELWHTADVVMVPQQKLRAAADGRRTLLAVWSLDEGRMVQLGSELMESAELLRGWRHAIENVAAGYTWGTMFGRPYRDVWLVDAATGARTRALERVRHASPSAGGRYLLGFDGRDYWSHDTRTGARVNLTASLPAVFADTAYDTPTDLLPPHGVAGWLDDDRAVLLYDRYDVWRVAPDGSGGERLTRGAEEEVVHRVGRIDNRRPTIDPRQPLYLTLRGEWTERRGFARIRPGRRDVERLVWSDHAYSGLMKADSADVLVYRAERFDTPPNFFVAGADLSGARQVTALNPFRSEYAWGRGELVEFTSEAGRRLKGSLLYPANHDPARRYPMIVYTYEIMSPQVHSFRVPTERDYYNTLTWTQEGYFVLLPDIVYRARDPGISALEAVRPAVARVVDMGLVDAARVGLIGHSWGGYQATFLPTRTNIFAASVAGAPLTDFVSFMGQIHWASGGAELDHWETGQGRMEVPYWEDPAAHHRNSPIDRVHEMETPLLMAHGNKDGVVEFFQATTFYNYARRAGKQMVLLVYDGEDHGFRQRANQLDYHRRILEWFGHYLKGEPAPAWITEGVGAGGMEAERRRVTAGG
jgi:dipeptidyl aminopeptidase/acylaminoacyl peptidase